MYVHIKKKTYCYEKEENTITQFKNYIHDGILSIKKKRKENPFDDFTKGCVFHDNPRERMCSLLKWYDSSLNFPLSKNF